MTWRQNTPVLSFGVSSAKSIEAVEHTLGQKLGLKKETSDRGDESGRWQMAGEPRLGVIQGQTVTALPRKILDRYRLSLGEGAGTAHCMTACTRRVISSASS